MNKTHVELIGHASILIQCDDKTLLTDPWYVDPVSCNTLFHWPPLEKNPEEIAGLADMIWISHNHSDHFDPASLAFFDASTPIYIGDYTNKSFRDQVLELGFNVIEVPFMQRYAIKNTRFVITLLESDYAESASFDSSIIVETPEYTLFNNNDCFLFDEKYDWVAENYNIDYGFLGYSPASFYPICFEMDQGEKDQLLRETADRKYNDFIKAGKKLRPTMSIPFAMGMRFLHQSMLWQNVSFNSAHEAVRRLETLELRGEVLAPGDKIISNGKIERFAEPYSGVDEIGQIAEYASQNQDWISALWENEEPAKESLISDFKSYLQEIWVRGRSYYPKAAQYVVAYRVEGKRCGSFFLEFSPSGDLKLVDGQPERFDIMYTYPDKILQLRMNGEVDWDDMHFSNRISVRQNRYPAEYYALLRAEGAKPQKNH